MHIDSKQKIEWPTIALFSVVWILFIVLTLNYQKLPWWLVLPAGGCLLALYGSMQHEVIHGHPTRWRKLNVCLVLPSLWLWLPFTIYRVTHLQHHHNELITDPFDDPESYYVASARWAQLSKPVRAFYLFRNTLMGRILLGPVWAMFTFLKAEIYSCLKGDIPRLRIWGWHLFNVVIILAWLYYCQIPFIEYVLLFVYPAVSVTLLRSFLEHQAELLPQHRTAVVSTGPFFSLLFLNNNLHALHHEQPTLPWYRLPEFWKKNRTDILYRNGGYFYAGYGTLFRRYFFKAKTHPRHPTI